MVQIVKQGEHYCHPKAWGISWQRKHSWVVRFNDSAVYILPGEDQYDINKLVGVLFPMGGWTKINGVNYWSRSAVFGWRWWQGSINIMAYIHEGKTITKDKLICTIDRNKDYVITLDFNLKNEYAFHVNENVLFYPKEHNHTMNCPKNLYFGGNLPAPQEISVTIKKIL